MIVNTHNGDRTPFEMRYNTKPNVQHYQVLRSQAYVSPNKEVHTNFEPKSFMVYVVAYNLTSKAYWFWDPWCNKVIESSNYKIDDTS